MEGKGLILFLSLGVSPPFLKPGLQSPPSAVKVTMTGRDNVHHINLQAEGRLSGGGRVLTAGTLLIPLDVRCYPHKKFLEILRTLLVFSLAQK